MSSSTAPHETLIRGHIAALTMGHGTVWVLGLLGLALGTARLRQRVAERDQAEAEVRHYRDHLQELVAQGTAEVEERNTEIRQLVRVVSHDLRAPLVNLRGFAAELRTSVEEAATMVDEAAAALRPEQRESLTRLLRDDAAESLDFVDAAANRMGALSDAIIRLSAVGRQTLQPEELDMDELVGAALRAMAHQLDQKNAHVAVSPLPAVVADRSSVEQILDNLLGNAVKYLDPNRPGRIEVSGEKLPDETVFHVLDNGRGIAESNHEHVFTPFRRARHDDVPGDGMGLAYVQTLVRRHGGRIWFESEESVRSTFSFTISHGLEASTDV